MNSEARLVAVVVVVLSIVGAVLRPLHPQLDDQRPETAAREAILMAGTRSLIPGGLRALAADMLWLKTYLAWAACDVTRTRTLIRAVTTIDDRPLCFWLNGARILAYDMVQWRLRAGGAESAPAPMRRRIVEEQATAALEYLEEARCRHHDGPAVRMEMANIHLYALGDPAGAAQWYRRAAELPGAPPCAARIYAELLQRLGRPREAYAWLCRLHPTLPPGNAPAMADVVLGRIRELEANLGLPESGRYVPARTEHRPPRIESLEGAGPSAPWWATEQRVFPPQSACATAAEAYGGRPCPPPMPR